MSLSNPTPNAFFFDIVSSDGKEYDAYLDLKMVVDFYDFQVRHRLKGTTDEWIYLSPDFNTTLDGEFQVNAKFDTPAKQDAEMIRICEGFSAAINKLFGKPNGGSGDRPSKGLDALQWLIKNKVTAIDNELKFNAD